MRRWSLLLGLVPLLGLAELGLHEYFARRAPGFEAYAELARDLAQLKAPGVPLVVVPAWAEPLVRQAAPDAFPFAELARPDNTGFAAFLEVSLFGDRAPELIGFPARWSRSSGPFTLSLLENPEPEPVQRDLVADVERGAVQVWHDERGERVPCSLVDRGRATTGGLHGAAARPRHRFECGGRAVVSATLIEDERYLPRRCLLVDPTSEGVVVLRFDALPSAERLVGWLGSSYFIEREVRSRTAELTVRVGEATLGTFGAAPAAGWSRFEQSLSSAHGPIEVAVRRLGSGRSDVCFALEAR